MRFACVMRPFFGLVSKIFRKMKEKKATKNHMSNKMIKENKTLKKISL